jgi:hypothetical protein
MMMKGIFIKVMYVLFVRRETRYDGLVREISFAKFSVEKFESISKEEWDKKCDKLIYAQPHIRQDVKLKSLIFADPRFFIEDIDKI